MPGLMSITKAYIPGEILYHTALNQSYDDIFDGLTPANILACGTSLGEMQGTDDPLPSGTESLPSTLREEVARIRDLIVRISGQTYWYTLPSVSLPSAGAYMLTGDNGTIGVGKSKTGMWFMEDTAPAGWTLESGCADAVLAVKGGPGLYNVAGGSKLQGSWTHVHAASAFTLTSSHVPEHHHHVTVYSVASGSTSVFTNGVYSNPYTTTMQFESRGGGGSHGAEDYLGAKKSGGTSGEWRPQANLGIICLKG